MKRRRLGPGAAAPVAPPILIRSNKLKVSRMILPDFKVKNDVRKKKKKKKNTTKKHCFHKYSKIHILVN